MVLAQYRQITVWFYLVKLKVDIPIDPAIPFLGLYLTKTHIFMHQDICIRMNCPSAVEWMNKLWCVHAVKYCAATKANERERLDDAS